MENGELGKMLADMAIPKRHGSYDWILDELGANTSSTLRDAGLQCTRRAAVHAGFLTVCTRAGDSAESA